MARNNPRFYFFAGTLFLTIAINFARVAWDRFDLTLNGKTAVASLVAYKEVKSRRHPERSGCLVKYQFRVEGSDTDYSPNEMPLGHDSFTEIDRDAFPEVLRTRKVAILYDSKDPWNNRPVQTYRKNEWWQMTILASVTFGLAVYCSILRARARQRINQKS